MFEERIINEIASLGNVDVFSYSSEISYVPATLNFKSLDTLTESLIENKAKKVAIIVTDRSRPTPTKELLIKIVPKLKSVGLTTYVVIATGLHKIRPNEISEIVGDLNADIFVNEPDKGNYIDLGTTPGGIPIKLLGKVVNADTIILIGSVIPHVWAGFSGGSKLLLPGTSARKTIIKHHLKYYNHPNASPGVTKDNPFRDEIDYVGDLMLNYADIYAINVINSNNTSIYGTFGRLRESYAKAVEISKKIYLKNVGSTKYDLLVIDGRPLNMNLYQSIKAVFNNISVSRDNASIILISKFIGELPTEFVNALNYENISLDETINKETNEIVPYLVAYSLKEKLSNRELIVLTEEPKATINESLIITNKYDLILQKIKKSISMGSKICIVKEGAKYVHASNH
ncbi:MAG: lactate racemase domain-containing protein [Sulfolobales archaeon]